MPARPAASPPRIRDVAVRAGVSAATVSRVLNSPQSVSAPRRERVVAAIDALGFRPSSLGRGLSLGRTGAIGVIAPFFTHPATVGRLRGITAVAAVEDYDVMIFNVETLKQRTDALREFARRDRIDGVLVVSLPLSDPEVDGLAREGLPAVLVDVAHPRLTRVVIDDVAGGRLATEHLLERGHTRIAFLGDVATSELGFTSSERRHVGYRQALTVAGIAADAQLVRRGPHGRESARAMARELLDGPARPTAIFAASDIQAIGALEAAAEAGVAVPGELAVIGFDDIDFADMVGLTTVRQPLADSGATGMELLLARLGDRAADAVEVVQSLSLIERRTA